MEDREMWRLNLELLPHNPTEMRAMKKEEEEEGIRFRRIFSQLNLF